MIAEHVPARTVMEGEIVRLSTAGRLDFGALLLGRNGAGRHAGALAVAAPCQFVGLTCRSWTVRTPGTYTTSRICTSTMWAGISPGPRLLARPPSPSRKPSRMRTATTWSRTWRTSSGASPSRPPTCRSRAQWVSGLTSRCNQILRSRT